MPAVELFRKPSTSVWENKCSNSLNVYCIPIVDCNLKVAIRLNKALFAPTNYMALTIERTNMETNYLQPTSRSKKTRCSTTYYMTQLYGVFESEKYKNKVSFIKSRLPWTQTKWLHFSTQFNLIKLLFQKVIYNYEHSSK